MVKWESCEGSGRGGIQFLIGSGRKAEDRANFLLVVEGRMLDDGRSQNPGNAVASSFTASSENLEGSPRHLAFQIPFVVGPISSLSLPSLTGG